MKNTLVINFIASAGSGKSTMAANLFAKLKWDGVDCELVSEFAKELVWEERHETFKDELYLFAKQNHRMFRVNGKVDVIITDRPVILSAYYNDKYGDKSDAFRNLVLETYGKYDNFNIVLNRKKKYNTNGRNQTEEESNKMQEEIIKCMDDLDIGYVIADGDINGLSVVYSIVKTILYGRGD